MKKLFTFLFILALSSQCFAETIITRASSGGIFTEVSGGAEYDGGNISITDGDLEVSDEIITSKISNTVNNLQVGGDGTLSLTGYTISLKSGNIFCIDNNGNTIADDGTLYVKAADDAVGVLTSSPRSALDVFGAIASGTKTVTAIGPTDNLDISDVNVIHIDSSSNDVTIGGFVGGIDGQVLFIDVIDATNTVTLEHNEGSVNQDIMLNSGADESLVSSYGGWTLSCNGTTCVDVSK